MSKFILRKLQGISNFSALSLRPFSLLLVVVVALAEFFERGAYGGRGASEGEVDAVIVAGGAVAESEWGRALRLCDF